MKRYQLFEFHELNWYPDLFREHQVEVLNLANQYTGFTDSLVEVFQSLLDETQPSTVLDLCSGSGGPVVLLLKALQDQGYKPPHLLLSDLYPHSDPWEKLRDKDPEWLDFVPESVDATNIEAHIDGDLVTIVNALHHFPTETVEKIIASVVQKGASLFVAEGFPRNLLRASAYLPSLFFALPTSVLQATDRTLARLLLSLSLLPLIGAWDWFASALRIHEPEELAEIGRSIAPHYEWKTGYTTYRPWGKAIYVTGIAPRSDI